MPKSARPIQRLCCRHKRRLHQDKDPKIDPVAAQKVCRGRELIECHALIQSGENFRMRRLQSHSDLQFAAKQVAKAQASFAGKRGMILHDQPLEAISALCDGGIVLRRNCLRIEKTAAVIELQLRAGGS